MKTLTKEWLIEFGNKHFVNEKYINHIVDTGRFCSHGSYLDECDELFEVFEEKFPNALNDKEMMKALLRHWLPLRISYISGEIIDELNYRSNLYRVVYFDQDKIKTLNTEDDFRVDDVGIYWSSSEYTDAYHLDYKKTKELTHVQLVIDFDFNTIDWFETFVSRIDFLNGDQEQEFQLDNDSYIKFKEVIVDENGNQDCKIVKGGSLTLEQLQAY